MYLQYALASVKYLSGTIKISPYCTYIDTYNDQNSIENSNEVKEVKEKNNKLH